MPYEEWSELYFAAFWYAYGKLNDNVRNSDDFANWFADQGRNVAYAGNTRAHNLLYISGSFKKWSESR